MSKLATMLGAGLCLSACYAAAQPGVRVEPSSLQGPRALEDQTRSAAIRDYLRAWASMRLALEQNRIDLLDADFVGAARDKLADTVKQQTALGIRTHYQDRSHDLQFVFYSPDGLSIELTDDTEYDVQIVDDGKAQTAQQTQARYLVVLTPAEDRWKVRVLQALEGRP